MAAVGNRSCRFATRASDTIQNPAQLFVRPLNRGKSWLRSNNWTISGARPQQKQLPFWDGISLNDYAQRAAPGSVPRRGALEFDAIQGKFSVLTSNYSAEYGQGRQAASLTPSRASGNGRFSRQRLRIPPQQARWERQGISSTVPDQFPSFSSGKPIRWGSIGGANHSTADIFSFFDYEGHSPGPKGITAGHHRSVAGCPVTGLISRPPNGKIRSPLNHRSKTPKNSWLFYHLPNGPRH